MRANRLQEALKHLGEALREAENALEEARAEPDPLAVHIFASRRQYRNMSDTKSGKRSESDKEAEVGHRQWRKSLELCGAGHRHMARCSQQKSSTSGWKGYSMNLRNSNKTKRALERDSGAN
jgi:hypothetical protein